MTNKLEGWLVARYDYLTGSVVGSSTGLILTPFTDVLVTLLICIATGFAGAFGAHLFKMLIEFYKSKTNGYKPQT